MWSGAATCSRVSPLCPFWPPEGLFDGPRRLLVRAARGGFLSPSLDGGLPLLELFNPSRRSSSARRAFSAAISAAWAATSAISSSCDGQQRESGSFIESLNRNPIPLSRKIYPHSPQGSPHFLRGRGNKRIVDAEFLCEKNRGGRSDRNKCMMCSNGPPSQRTGIEFTNDYRLSSWLHADANVALSRARFLGFDNGQEALYQSLAGFPQVQIGNAPGNYVFNAPWMVASAGVTLGD